MDELAAFCRYWRMTPRDVDLLTDEEYDAFCRFLQKDARDRQRELRRAQRARR